MKNINNKCELLAPAGSLESLYAAINAGADAVYLGGEKFGARAYADNPDMEALLKAMDYTHIHSKQMYLTVNTLLKDSEIENQLYDYILPLYENGLDAVIVQDLGVFNFIKNNFKNLDIHASTQMAVMGTDSAKLLKDMGASRVVTARELSLNEIKEIHNSVDIEIESFIHGSMCYSYSGLCLFSSIIGGRSGNRGRCAGPCRQPYEVFHNNKRINDENSLYALSLKDMNTLTILPEILQAGVYSLKIEGRMKSPEYVALVTSIYRKYIDLYYESAAQNTQYEQNVRNGFDNFRLDKKDVKNLNNFYTRSDSTTGYYKCHNSKDMISVQKGAYKNSDDHLIQEINEKYCGGLKKISVKAEVYIEPEKNIVLKISGNAGEIKAEGEEAGIAKNRPIDEASVIKQINKTGDSFLEFEDIKVDISGDSFVPVSKLNDLRRNGINEYLELALAGYRRENINIIDNYCVSKEYNTIKNNVTENNTVKDDVINDGAIVGYNRIKKLSDSIDNIDSNFNKVIPKLCVQITDMKQLDKVLQYKKYDIDSIHISIDLLSLDETISAIGRVLDSGKICYVNMPAIFRTAGKKYFKELLSKLNYKGYGSGDFDCKQDSKFISDRLYFSASNIDEYAFLVNNNFRNIAINNSLYAFNKYAKEFYYESGVKKVTLPYELNYKELKKLCDNRDEIIVYGYIPLMISAGCVYKNYVNCTKSNFDKTDNSGIYKDYSGKIVIKDRLGAKFDVINCCNFCYNIIYNNLPLSLIGKAKKVRELNLGYIRVNFTTENDYQINEILDKCIEAFINKNETDDIENFTRGHFNRGVE